MQRQTRVERDRCITKELEAIVLRDLQSVERGMQRPARHPSSRVENASPLARGGERSRAGEAAVAKPAATPESKAADAALERELQEIFGKPNGADEDSLGLPDEGVRDEGPGPLNEEEERFVTEAVTWLRQRENKDAIIARIWDVLIETEPETFFSPEPEEPRPETAPGVSEPEESGEQGAGEGDRERLDD